MILSLIRTDHVNRFHVYADAEAVKFTAVRVELFPHLPVLVGNADMTPQELWLEAMATLRWLRSEPGQSLYPSSVFIPFAKIIAVDRDVDARDRLIQNLQVVGDHHPDHETRVRALCAALDLIDGAPLPQRGVWN